MFAMIECLGVSARRVGKLAMRLANLTQEMGDPQRPPVSTDRRRSALSARRSRKKMTGVALHYRSVTPFNYLGHKL